jgi:hypothetical protein
MKELSIHPERAMEPLEAAAPGPFAGLIVRIIRVYQFFSRRLWPRNCRFYPTCSQYAVEAIHKHGLGRGTWLATKRICRCHPFHPGGVDLVP